MAEAIQEKLNCEITVPKVEGLEDSKLTVGRKIELKCSGPLPAQFDFSKASFKTTDSDQHSLKLLKVEPSAGRDQLFLDYTYYTAGSKDQSALTIFDGQGVIILSAPNVNIESVLQPPQDGKPQQPYGPIFPISIAVPYLYYAIFSAVILAVLSYFIFSVRRFSYYKKLREGLKKYDSPIEPDTQFYRAVRVSEKKGFPIVEVEEAFKIYNLRAYQLPMFELGEKKLIKYCKKMQPQNKAVRVALIRHLEEIQELKQKESQLDQKDKNEFVKKLYRYIETHKGNAT